MTSSIERASKPVLSGHPLINDSFANQDLGFSHESRQKFHLRGLLPDVFETLEQQALRANRHLESKTTPLGKYIYLSSLRQSNARLFYYMVTTDMLALTPFIYTPTVGQACERWSEIYRRPEGLYISIKDSGSIKEVLANWALKDARIAVVTDGSRILGLGDLGVGGMGISIGKLALYVGGSGVRPDSTLPIVLDMGTDNQSLLDDPIYLGLKEKRRPLKENVAFMDEFMQAMQVTFPKIVVQFEDFSSEAAFFYLDRYAKNYPMFNDDIQGTGAVILGGYITAAVQSSQASGRELSDQKIVFLGAGSAAVGVAKQLMSFFTRNGVSEEEARKRFWLVDTKGLVTLDRGDKLAEHKVFFARDDNEGKQYKSLEDVVDYVKPTSLIGLSTTYGAFSKEIVEKMVELNPRPIIFPLSNPTTKCEVSFEDALSWSDGKVIFASGSPFDAVDGREAGQANNMYIFPGLGLGTLISGAKKVTDHMIEETSLALSESLNDEEKAANLLYPRLARLPSISAEIALRVMRAAQKEGVDTTEKYRSLSDADLLKVIESKQFKPSYDTLSSSDTPSIPPVTPSESRGGGAAPEGEKKTEGAGGSSVGGSGVEAVENEILEGSGQSEELAGIAAS